MPQVRYVGLAVIQARGLAAVRKATLEAANDLIAKAVEVTPIEEGTLRSSIHLAETRESGTTFEATVATGAEASAYAIYIHEGMRQDGTHVIRNYHGGQGKYLEGPLLAQGPTYRAHIAKAARAAY